MGRLEIDRAGLAKVLEKKGYAWILYELVQNALDEAGVTKVSVDIRRQGQFSEVVVEDDSPTGFRDLSHAWTMYAESYKKTADLRGRFNIGEKLVVALANYAEISSTTGTVRFQKEERHVDKTVKRDHGSKVTVLVKSTLAQHEELVAAVSQLIVPPGIILSFNGKFMPGRDLVSRFECTLSTEVPGDDGVLRPTQRKTWVELYEPKRGETASIYEMGIPVVDIGDRFHVNIMQRVPLTPERDNVRPAYLKAVRAFVLENTHQKLDKDEFTKPWVSQAVTDGRVGASALGSYLDAKYGTQRVVHDPSSAESTSVAQAAGYQLVAGRSEAKETWEKIRAAGLIKPASAVFPVTIETITTIVPEDEWTPGMRNIAEYSKAIALKLLGKNISVNICNDPEANINACYGQNSLTYNLGRLGFDWFNSGPTRAVNNLLIHELGHDTASNHLDRKYYDALTNLGAGLAELALSDPELFKKYGHA